MQPLDFKPIIGLPLARFICPRVPPLSIVLASGAGVEDNQIMGRRKFVGASALIALLGICAVAAAHAEVVDRIVAVVGGSVMSGAALGASFVPSGVGAGDRSRAGATVITWSGVLEEANYRAFRQNMEPVKWKPGDPVSAPDFREVLNKMIDRALLEQELKRSPFAPAGGSTDIQDQIQMVERKFPDAAAYHSALERYHLTEEKLAERLTRESILFAFVDATLRAQARPTEEQVQDYYQTTLLPELRQQNGGSEVTPQLEDVRGQIEEILVQRQLDSLLEQWLDQLRHGAQIDIWSE